MEKDVVNRLRDIVARIETNWAAGDATAKEE